MGIIQVSNRRQEPAKRTVKRRTPRVQGKPFLDNVNTIAKLESQGRRGRRVAEEGNMEEGFVTAAVSEQPASWDQDIRYLQEDEEIDPGLGGDRPGEDEDEDEDVEGLCRVLISFLLICSEHQILYGNDDVIKETNPATF
jgi:hypothetical protein